MTQLSRRELLVSAAAVAAVANIPAAIAATVPAEIIPSWAVGSTDGEWDWQRIVARTEAEAKHYWAGSWSAGKCNCKPGDGFECDYCCAMDRAEAVRKPVWDGKEKLTDGDWIRGGMGCYCSRCSSETYSEENGHAIGDEAVCEDCMELADWDIADPERADEIRQEMIEDGDTPPPRSPSVSRPASGDAA